jgi:uncharacterized membrane protein YfcA
MWIIVGLILSYVIITLFMPVLTDVVTSTDAALIATTDNISHYTGAKEVVDWTPWALYLIPGFIGVIATVIVLRQPSAP